MIVNNISQFGRPGGASELTTTVPYETQRRPAKEEGVLSHLRLQAPVYGGRLWRNNVGAVHTSDGRFLRYGLANDSSAMNSSLKSSDLIGIMPVIITPSLIGMRVGVFMAIETKRPDWKYTGTPREKAQLAWLRLIYDLGGITGFSTGGDV